MRLNTLHQSVQELGWIWSKGEILVWVYHKLDKGKIDISRPTVLCFCSIRLIT